MSFEWTPAYWQGWREANRKYKSERDRSLTVEALELRDGERVWEVGCGYGWITEALLNATKIRWVGLDRSESTVKQLVPSPPKFAFGFLHALDRWAVERVPGLAYEMWFTAKKG